MRVSLILFIILAQFANGYLVESNNMKLQPNIKKSISRKQCLNLLGTSLISIATPTKKANAVNKCNIDLDVEKNKNVELTTDVYSLEFLLVYQYILLLALLKSVTDNFY